MSFHRYDGGAGGLERPDYGGTIVRVFGSGGDKGGFGKGGFCEPDFAPETGAHWAISDDTLAFKSFGFR